MFNIDLLNSSGLQKIISRNNPNNSKNKQRISFSSETDSENNSSKPPRSSKKSVNNLEGHNSLLSYVIFGFFIVAIISCFFIDFYNGVSFTNNTKISAMVSSQEEHDDVLSSVIKSIGNPEYAVMLNTIDLDKSLYISFESKDLDIIYDIRGDVNYKYKIYTNANGSYQIIIEYPLMHWDSNSLDGTDSLIDIINHFGHMHNVEITMDDDIITFVSNSKIILIIFETLMFSGQINISANDQTNTFSLQYFH